MFKVLALGAVIALTACGGVLQRFPDDVQAALARDSLRRLETDHFILYYPAQRRAEIDRFLVRAERCADTLREAAVLHDGPWHDKMVIALPEVAFNNAFVLSEALGYEHVSVIPTFATLDFATEFGLPPDPGFIACHELVHYVHLEQIAGFWRTLDLAFGHLYSPQLGYDPWFLEGLATHYEAKQAPGLGRPSWPIFTGMFAAAYAGRHVGGGELSVLGRLAPVGHHYLVGSMFVRFLTERYGERPLWLAIARQASALTGLLSAGTFKDGLGVGFGDLLDQFDAWCAQTFPVRRPPAGQRRLATLGNDARYARGRDGTEAWVADDVDAPARLVVRAPDGAHLAELGLVDVVPPRTLVQAAPLLVSGLSVTADGSEVWLTMIDAAATYQVPRLLRWRRGETRLTELRDDLGPGATIDPRGGVYYYCAVDGDRWSLAAWDTVRGTRRVVIDAPPGTYVLGAQVSADGTRLVANVWDGGAFVAWVLDAATGARLAELRGAPGAPIWDASFTDEGEVMYLGVVDGRFQAMIDGRALTDAPYAVLAARGTRGSVRFLNRDGWRWTLDEIAAPAAREAAALEATSALAPPAPMAPLAVAAPPAAAAPPAPVAQPAPAATPADPPSAAPGAALAQSPQVQSDEPFTAWERFFVPQLHSPTIVVASTGVPHLGAVLGGGDRLGMQRWSLAGYVQPRGEITDQLHWGADAAYLNTMLAPWQIVATAGFVDWVDPVATDDPKVTLAELRRTRDASLAIARTWRGSLITRLAAVYTQDFDQPPGEAGVRRELGGPAASLSWFSAETTGYTGLFRALLLDAATAYYPHALSSFAGDIYDVGGAVGAVVPLPLGRRHTLAASLRGRALLARDDTDLLQLGGASGTADLWTRRSTAAEPPAFDAGRFPPSQRFIEPLRGYEDYAITTDRAAIGELAWRYPVIIDRGVAATLGFLPASFVRELDLELFATGAYDRRGALHAALGASIALRISLLRVPLLVEYQLARRVRDDDALTQRVGLAIEL